jgi:quercetin dioxygenase-like cupin family protein
VAHRVVSADNVPTHDVSEWGHAGVRGTFRPVGEMLGVSAFGLNQLELAPGAEGPEHDHLQDGQEEAYVVVRGGGKIRVEGTEHELRPGDCVFVSPDGRRQLVAGPDGLAWIGIGCKPGAYEPPESA